jgi:mannose-6-phosphate isomerase-like protein (cupin superfamily)
MNINLREKLQKVQSLWHPYIIGELNENYVKIAKGKGELIWHSHEDDDELFVVIKGTLIMDFRDKTIVTQAGEILIVPKGVEHRPRTAGEEEVHFMLIEPKALKHTGDIITEQTVQQLEWI